MSVFSRQFSIVMFTCDCDFQMNIMREQHICITFCFKPCKIAIEMHKILVQAFGNDTLGQMQMYNWLKHFENCRTSADDNEHSWQPSISIVSENAIAVHNLIMEDCKWQEHCMNVCSELKELLRTDSDFLSKVIAGDKSWVYGYAPTIITVEESIFTSTKKCLSQQVQHQILICLIDTDGIIHKEFILPGQVIDR